MADVESTFRLLTLAAVVALTEKHGSASEPGLVAGLKVVPSRALIASLLTLERNGLITHTRERRDDGTCRVWRAAEGVSLDCGI
jgi:hypothetical protein